MSRTATSLPVSPDPTNFGKTTHYDPLKNDIDLIQLGQWCRNSYMGGSEVVAFSSGTGTGYTRAIDQIPFTIDNTSNQVSGSSGLVSQITVCVRVDSSTISVTPRIYNLTDASAVTTGTACNVTTSDFSGTNQTQTLTLTPASGVKSYIIQIAKSADTNQAFAARIFADLYIAG